MFLNSFIPLFHTHLQKALCVPGLITAAGKGTSAAKDWLLGIYFPCKEAEKVEGISQGALGRAGQGNSMNQTVEQGSPPPCVIWND